MESAGGEGREEGEGVLPLPLSIDSLSKGSCEKKTRPFVYITSTHNRPFQWLRRRKEMEEEGRIQGRMKVSLNQRGFDLIHFFSMVGHEL